MKYFLLFFSFFCTLAMGQAQEKNPKAIADFLDRIGGKGTAKRFTTVLMPLQQQGEKEYFSIDFKEGKPLIEGNSISAITKGVHWYLMHYVHLHLSWNNGVFQDLRSIDLPPLPEEKPFIATSSVPYRYYLNYCTYSYSMAFWDWARWEKELDFMALHGINLPLTLVGTEVVWRNVLKELGYSKQEIGDFIAGPAYQAWWLMNNLEGWGGKNPDWWYLRQEKLAKKIIKRMRELGMQPVLAGYSGMLPSNIQQKKGWQANDIGHWCAFKRPTFLPATSPHFQEMAGLYYKHLHQIFGSTAFYSIDPFHEGGNTNGIDLRGAYQALFKAMQKANPEAIWVMQGWQENPKKEALESIEKGKLLILDLFSDGEPQKKFQYHSHDFVFCMLPNFGGRIGLHGRFDATHQGFYQALNHPNLNLKGIGATSEGIENNPILYDLLYELPWQSKLPEDWLNTYSRARYGVENKKATECWWLLKNSIYNCSTSQQGTTESVFCAQPSLQVKSVSTWSSSQLSHNIESVIKAGKRLYEARESLSGENYLYDLTDIWRQILADKGNLLLKEVKEAYEGGRKEDFLRLKEEFLNLILLQDRLLSTQSGFSLGQWTSSARDIAKYRTQADQNWLEYNARMQITTWGGKEHANQGGLRDYSHREWGGLLRDFYYPRWQVFFNELERGLPPTKDWYPFEIQWITNFNKSYSPVPQGDTLKVVEEIINTYFYD